MLSSALLFSIGDFCQHLPDLACYACEKSKENTLNIKQESDRILIPDSGLSQLDSDTLDETLPEKTLKVSLYCFSNVCAFML